MLCLIGQPTLPEPRDRSECVMLNVWCTLVRIMELSLSRTFVPGNESSRYGTFVAGNENAMELSFPGAKVTWNFCSQ